MKFSKRDIIQNSWQVLRGHLGLWILIMLFIFFLNIIISSIQERLFEDIKTQTVLFTAAAYLFQAGLNLGMLKIALNIHRNEEIEFNQIFESFHMLVGYILATLVFLAILFVVASPGTILLMVSVSSGPDLFANIDTGQVSFIVPIILIIVPAVYVSVRLQFYDYFLIDQECGPIDSIKESLNATRGHTGELFVLGMILSVIVLISIIPLMVGLLISIPLVIMVNTHVYIKLKDAN